MKIIRTADEFKEKEDKLKQEYKLFREIIKSELTCPHCKSERLSHIKYMDKFSIIRTYVYAICECSNCGTLWKTEKIKLPKISKRAVSLDLFIVNALKDEQNE